MKINNELQVKNIKDIVLTISLLLILSIFSTCIVSMIYTSSVSVFLNHYIEIILLAVCMFCVFSTLYAYFYYLSNNRVKTKKNVIILFSTVIVTLFISVACVKYINVWVAPIAISAVVVGLLVSRSTGFIANLAVSILLILITGMLEYDVYGNTFAFLESSYSLIVATIESFCIMYLVKKNYTRFKLIFGSLAIGAIVSLLAIVLALSLKLDIKYALICYAYSFVSTCLSAVGFTLIIPFYEEVFNVWTNFKLAEACCLSRPLLKKLATEAPGTFNHSIIVSNLAEACAIAIGENPYLAKACGIYHDVGKVQNPEFFVENQAYGYNPHDDLIPEHSARMIISHCSLGYDMLKKARLPEEIAVIAKEHHGTTHATYFYNRAKAVNGGELDDTGYRYDGPKPTSKIAVIIMIADGVEAATRAKSPKDTDELVKIIDSIIDSKIKDNQFSDADITFSDLDEIKHTILKVIPAVYHKRIDYQKASDLSK